jgi:hypothetical protein
MPPLLRSLRCGSRLAPPGKGVALHLSRRAVNLLFGTRVITLLNRRGTLTPSSIVIDAEVLPPVGHASWDGSTIETGAFAIKAENQVELRVARGQGFDARLTKEIMAPFLEPRERSIAVALLRLEGARISHREGLEQAISERQLAALRTARSTEELARGLLGLGFGLTPSGDDFLVGVIAAMNLAGLDVEKMRSVVSDYDNPFARTVLCDAVDCYYFEPLCRVVESIQDGSLSESMIEGLLRVGHTSGLDTLAGMHFALGKMESDEGLRYLGGRS